MKTYTVTEGDLLDFAATSRSGDRWELVDEIRARAEEHVLPIQGTQLGYVHHMEEGDDYDQDKGRQFDIVTGVEDANVITSKMVEQIMENEETQLHYIVLDVDYPVHAIPSTTPGHSHLYIEKAITWSDYKDLLEVLSELGIVQEGYYRASEREGFTSVRLPWVKKESIGDDGPVIIPTDPTVPEDHPLGF